MARTICCTLGAGFILAGVAGFVEPDLLGMHLTPVHNVIHLVSGVLSLYFGFAGSTEAARVFSLVFGTVYAGLGVLGFVAPSLVESLLHAESSAGTGDRLVADNIVHHRLVVPGRRAREAYPRGGGGAFRLRQDRHGSVTPFLRARGG